MRRLRFEIIRTGGRRRRLLATAAFLVVLGLSAVACAGASKSASGPASNTARSTNTALPSSSSPSSPSSPTRLERVRRQYPAGGPTDPVLPPGLPTYSLLAAGNCNVLLDATQTWNASSVPDAEGVDTTPLYMSAAYACLGRWPDAERVYTQIHATQPDFKNFQCTRNALLRWLTALIVEREKDPNFSPIFEPSSAPSPCPQEDPTTTTEISATVPTSTTVPTTTSAPSVASTTSTP
jgi:hypothetical protein